MKSGIYEIRNKINGKRYIGSAVNVRRRLSRHKNNLRRGAHPNPHLNSAWNKYGEDSFDFKIIVHCPKEELIMREQEVIDNFHPEYNIRAVADSNLGMKWSEETRKKMSESHTGELHPNWGIHLSEETREKISRSLTRELHYNWGKRRELNHMWGRHHSEETRKKLSDAQTGRRSSKETRKKMSKSQRLRRERERLEPQTL